VTILVTGRGGQVARALTLTAARRKLALKTLGRPELDLETGHGTPDAIFRAEPHVVINAAAYTAVDKAEDEPARAQQVNGVAAGALAEACAAIGAWTIQISTDYVFSGEKPSAYLETDPPEPVSQYGRSKLLGEELVKENNPRSIIVRTAWVYDASGSNFVRTMLRLAKAREEVAVVADQRGCPTFASDLSEAILTIASAPKREGIYHCVGSGETTWAEFAVEIFEQARARGGPHARVRQISSSEYPMRAPRPKNSRLDCANLMDHYDIRMRHWRKALTDCIDEIAAGGWRVE